MPSSRLKAERTNLLKRIDTIRQSGSVAPAYCWLTVTTVIKENKAYFYARLVSQKPGKKTKVQSLGRLGSPRHQEWKGAIARREEIVELEQQLKLLQGLIDRQAATASLIGAVLIDQEN